MTQAFWKAIQTAANANDLNTRLGMSLEGRHWWQCSWLLSLISELGTQAAKSEALTREVALDRSVADFVRAQAAVTYCRICTAPEAALDVVASVARLEGERNERMAAVASFFLLRRHGVSTAPIEAAGEFTSYLKRNARRQAR